MSSIVIIPARGSSKRIKDKNIIDFYGKPLITYSLDSAKKSNLFDVIHVSTDCKKIKLIADNFLENSSFLRNPELADDDTGIIPVLRWVVSELQNKGEEFDDVCMLLPTAPLITPFDLIEAHKVFIKENRKFPVVAVTRYPAPIEWAYSKEVKTEKLSRTFSNTLTNVKSQELIPKFYDAGAFAFFDKIQLMDESYDIGSTLVGYELPRHRAVDIDTLEDLKFAKLLFNPTNDLLNRKP